jgi:hypothetical protein
VPKLNHHQQQESGKNSKQILEESTYAKALVLIATEVSNLESNDVGVVTGIEKEVVEVFFIGRRLKVRLPKKDVQVIDPHQTGDNFESKICNKCHKILDVKEFDLNQNGKNNRPVRRPSCKKCRKDIDGVGMTAGQKKYWNSIKPVKEIFECPICGKVTIAGVTSKVVLNHDHQTGKPSGWICDSCNTGLGRFKDDPEVLRSAIEYLEEAKESQE